MLLWIMKIVVGDTGKDFVEELAALPSCHGEVVEQVVAAVLRSSSWDIALVVSYEEEGAEHQVNDVAALIVASKQKVVAGEAPHGSPIDHTVLPFRVVAKIGSREMLDGVDGSLSKRWFTVRFLHADVEGGDGLAPHSVLPAHINSTQQSVVIDSE